MGWFEGEGIKYLGRSGEERFLLEGKTLPG